MSQIIITNSAAETKKFARAFAKKILKNPPLNLLSPDRNPLLNPPPKRGGGKRRGETERGVGEKAPQQQGALVIGLCGELGSGKTTFVQGFVREFGIRDRITSPTFVLMKRYSIPQILQKKFQVSSPPCFAERGRGFKFQDLYHIDCYRLESAKDLLDLGLEDTIKNPENIILIEWPEKIKKALPRNSIFLKFLFIDDKKREIRTLPLARTLRASL